MSTDLFQIDISNYKYVGEEDLIKINIGNDNLVQVSFSKLVNYSKYIRDKYKYSEAMISIEDDLKKFAYDNEIKEESLKHFIELIEEEKVKMKKEYYCDIYRLSEYFDIPIFICALDKIRKEMLIKDINFTLQFLYETTKSIGEEEETKLNSKMEEFITTHINECILNDKFSSLPASTIYRILEKSSKETLDDNLLVEFILKSIDTRFIFLKFVKLHKLSESEVDRFFKMMSEQSQKSKEQYFEYIPFDLIFLERQKERCKLLFEEANLAKEELQRTKIKLNQTEYELKQAKSEINKSLEQMEQAKKDHALMKIKLDQTEDELKQAKNESNLTNEELIKMRKDNGNIKIKLEQTKEELEKTKIEINKYAQSVVVAGSNKYNQLGEKANNKDKDGNPIISPPLILSFNHSLLSYSIYFYHSVLIMNDGSLQGIGYNKHGIISSSLTKSEISQFTEFSIKDDNGQRLTPLSAVCCSYGTLYMFMKSEGIGKQLVYCDKEINNGNTIFLNIGNHEPVAIFGGHSYAAAINCEGEIIFINHELVKNSPDTCISAISLPNNEKAISISCCND